MKKLPIGPFSQIRSHINLALMLFYSIDVLLEGHVSCENFDGPTIFE